MEYNYSYQNLSRPQQALQRFFEVLPGAISWGILSCLILISFLRPLTAAAIIIAFGFYWFLRLSYLAAISLLRRWRLELEAKTDWLARARGLNRVYAYWKELNEYEAAAKGKQDFSLLIHRRQIRLLEKSKQKAPALDALHHLIIIPVSSRNQDLVGKTIASLIGGNFPSIKIVIVLALKSGMPESSKLSIRRMIERYRAKFFDFIIIPAPEQKQSNERPQAVLLNAVAVQAADYFTEKKIAFKEVIVSCLNPGIVVNPDYCSCLTYDYMVLPDRQAACFQPQAVYDASAWEALPSKRVVNAASSFFQLIRSNNPASLISFSGYSMSLATLVDIGYWPSDLLSTDIAVLWKALIHYNAVFKPTPIYVAYPMNILEGPEATNSLSELYQRKKRLALAGENFSIVMRAFLKAWRMPFFKRVVSAFKMLESQIIAGIWPFIVFVIAWFPALLAGREFSDSGVYYCAPRITFVIFFLMIACFVMSIVLTNLVLPRKVSKIGFLKQLIHFLTLIFLVLVGVFLTSIATLSVQTSFLSGRRPKP